MENNNSEQNKQRRDFLGTMATGAAAIGLAAIASPFRLNAQDPKAAPTKSAPGMHPADVWFNKVNGTHRVVYDCTRPHEIFPFAWPLVFLMTNEATGSPASDCGVVVILRHAAICYAFKDRMWEKYGFVDVFEAGEIGPSFQAADAATALKKRNPFWNTQPDDFKVPGFGSIPIGIKDLQAKGVMFCVCNAAMAVYSAAVAQKMSLKHEEVLNEWTSELIPDIQVVPSGVWAAGRAQEHGCKYIFAG